jgi:hypothetical protein
MNDQTTLDRQGNDPANQSGVTKVCLVEGKRSDRSDGMKNDSLRSGLLAVSMQLQDQ